MTKDALPETVVFNVFGAGGPAEEQQKRDNRFASAQQAIRLDLIRIQQGQAPVVNSEALIKELLTEGGWTDVDAITNSAGVSQGAGAGPPVEGSPGVDPGATAATLQAIAGGA